MPQYYTVNFSKITLNVLYLQIDQLIDAYQSFFFFFFFFILFFLFYFFFVLSYTQNRWKGVTLAKLNRAPLRKATVRL